MFYSDVIIIPSNNHVMCKGIVSFFCENLCHFLCEYYYIIYIKTKNDYYKE